MTPFLDSLNGLTRPEKLFAFTLKELADERGNVTLEWSEVFELVGVTSRGRVRAMLSSLKRAGIGHGSTNDLVHWKFEGFQYVKTSARSAREYAQYVKTSNHGDYRENGYSAQYVKTSDQSAREYAQSARGSDQFGGDKGGGDRYIHRINRLIQENSLNENDLSIYLSGDDQKRTVTMLTDEVIAMPQKAAEVAAIVTAPDRAVSVTANWLSEVESGQPHTAIGLLARLTDRDEQGNYKFPAKAVPPGFYRSEFAQRHGVAPPRNGGRGYEVPGDMQDIFIG